MKDDAQVLVEIERWQKRPMRTGFLPAALNLLFSPVDKLVDLALPDKLLNAVSGGMRDVLVGLRDSGESFVNVKGIVAKAAEAGLPIEKVEDFKHMPIAYLDALAKSLFGRNQLYMTLQGAGLGTAGFAAAFIDYPMLFLTCLKLTFQIGVCYGYSPFEENEKEFALRVFCLLAAQDEAERRKEFGRLDDLALRFFREDVVAAELKFIASTRGLEMFINRQLRWFAKKRALRSVPIAGIITGGGFDYLHTREVALYAFMSYRKRFLTERMLGDKIAVSSAKVGK